jgi:hypothetical protein
MFKKKILLLLLFLLGFSYFFTLEFGYYFKYPWIDLPLHFLGGVIVSLFFIIYFEKSLKKLSLFSLFLFLLSFVALIGIFWEFFEWIVDKTIYPLNQPTVNDTLGDLAMDLLGGFLVAFIYFIKIFSQFCFLPSISCPSKELKKYEK